MELRIMKVLLLFGIFAFSFVGFLPLCNVKGLTSNRFRANANVFSAGVFMAVALLHIYPEASAMYMEPFTAFAVKSQYNTLVAPTIDEHAGETEEEHAAELAAAAKMGGAKDVHDDHRRRRLMADHAKDVHDDHAPHEVGVPCNSLQFESLAEAEEAAIRCGCDDHDAHAMAGEFMVGHNCTAPYPGDEHAGEMAGAHVDEHGDAHAGETEEEHAAEDVHGHADEVGGAHADEVAGAHMDEHGDEHALLKGMVEGGSFTPAATACVQDHLEFEEISYRKNRGEFPVIQFAAMCGFLFVLLIEKVAFTDFHEMLHSHDSYEGGGHGGHERKSVEGSNYTHAGHGGASVNGGGHGGHGGKGEAERGAHDGHNHGHGGHGGNVNGHNGVHAHSTDSSKEAEQGYLESHRAGVEFYAIQSVPLKTLPVAEEVAEAQIDVQFAPYDNKDIVNSQTVCVDQSAIISREQSNYAVSAEWKKENACAPYFLMVALGTHSLFEGMALGLASNNSEVFSLLIAIVSHKIPVCFGVAVSFAKSDTPRCKAWILCTIFALLSPLGIGTGIALIEAGGSSPQTVAILMAITTGMFFYIAMTEVIPEEFAQHSCNTKDKWLKYFFLILGAATMTCVTYFNAKGGGHAAH